MKGSARSGITIGMLGTLALLACGTRPVMGQEACSRPVGDSVDQGWALYRQGLVEAAGRRFEEARRCEPGHLGAAVGLGYVALREGRHNEASRLFEAVVGARTDDVDALLGLAYVAEREGDPDRARERFRTVLEVDPGNPEGRRGLDRLAEQAPAPRPEQPPLILPDTLVYPARAAGDRFEVWTPRGWEPFYVNGINLGAALPGRHPSEFPDRSVYERWIEEMAEMGANTVRVYTIHPPDFYDALARHNRTRPERSIWLVHGVWAELPPDDDYMDPDWEGAFFAEMRSVVDLIHGRADIDPRPGHAAGSYTSDVSRWTLAYIIGREWEPYSVLAFNARRPELTRWDGGYLRVAEGSPMEVWLARACEEIVAYETETYHAQRPVAYTNWPTLDPLHHPTETTVGEEVTRRKAGGERVERAPREYDNDAVGLDATRGRATTRFPAGTFASFHAYPYYPDFMVLDPGYARAVSPFGPSSYFGYLRELKAHHAEMPVLIAEYGVPASLGIAHLQPQGWHHGGRDEAAMAEIDARLTREIAAAGMAGGIVFAWIDEWFKKNWIVIEFEIPLDRNRLWLNRLDAEQHYGMIAMDPRELVSGATLAERLQSWRAHDPLYETPEASLRAAADEAYLWLLFETGPDGLLPDELLIGFDTVDPAAGDFRWPDRQGPRSPVGFEFVLRVVEGEARLVADPPLNPFRVERVREGWPERGLTRLEIPEAYQPPGFFAGRYEQRFNAPYQTRFNEDGIYDSLRVVTNRPRFGRDDREHAGMGYDRGVLRQGPPPDGLWETTARDRASIEVRIPWMLLDFTDPSQRRLLHGGQDADRELGGFGTTTVEGIGLVVASRRGVRWTQLPATDRHEAVRRFTWETWEEPRWRARRRPAFDALREVFAELERGTVTQATVR